MFCNRLVVCLLGGLLIFSGAANSSAQSGRTPLNNCATVAGPCVDKVDPPNWWAALPSPMLLLHGDHLRKAKFTISGNGVSVDKSKVSANGHYAFVWLKTDGATSQDIHIHVSARSGSMTVPYSLNQRKPAGYRGFSSADAMYLILTDRFADGDLSNDNFPPGFGVVDRTKPTAWHGGDLRGIEQHLDYLQQLGITTVWITPAYESSGEPHAYHGYDATDMYAVDPHFGTLADYERLAADLHSRGMKFVLDLVPNHVGPAHPWAVDPPTPDWFHGTPMDHRRAKSNFASLVSPDAGGQGSLDVVDGWFSNVKPDLNQDNPLVEKYLIQNAVWWVESAGLDGLRLDTFPYVQRTFWHDFHATLHELYPHLTTVGEIFNHDPAITSFFAGGVAHQGVDSGLDTPFDFPMFSALRNTLVKDAPMTALDEVLRQDRLYPHPERLVPFLGNHDTGRFMSEPGATPAKLKMGFGLLTTMRGMPQIYSGDEIAMRGGKDPDNRHDFPGGFPGDTKNAFTAQGRTPEEQDMYTTVAALLHYRAAHTSLKTGEQKDIFADQSAFAFVRAVDIQTGCTANHKEDRVLVVANRADQPRELTLPLKDSALEGCTHFEPALRTNSKAVADSTSVHLTVAPQTVAIYQVQ
ncbi:alpha-amylase family glycosyl hydrolase [Edaphobacter paludis]|uniref:Alpha-amylase family glycosyl hydrolase n=1 Tax=Edaphobacter paludis TaxID=3035702 RepID=A0AAU7D4C0_9BACT